MGDHLRNETASGHLRNATASGHLMNDYTAGGDGYLFYGFVGGVASQSTDQYDATGDAWTNLLNAPAPTRSGLASFVIGTKGYAVGDTAGFDVSTEEFDPTGPSWTSKTDISAFALTYNPGSDVGSTGHVFGDIFAATNYEYVVDSWTTKTVCPMMGNLATACSISGVAYVLWAAVAGTFHSYVIDTWTALTNFPATGRSYAAMVTVGTKAYLMGGYGAALAKDCYEYDPTGNSWTAKTSAPNPTRRGHLGLSLNSKAYFFGGDDTAGTYYADVDYYDPVGDSWTSATDMAATRTQMGGVVL